MNPLRLIVYTISYIWRRTIQPMYHIIKEDYLDMKFVKEINRELGKR